MGILLICLQLYKTIIAKISIGMVVQNSTRTMVVGKITDIVYPKNRVSVKKYKYHNVLFAVVLTSNIISSGITT